LEKIVLGKGIAELFGFRDEARAAFRHGFEQAVQVVRLFQRPAEADQLRLEHFFEHLGQLAARSGKAELASHGARIIGRSDSAIQSQSAGFWNQSSAASKTPSLRTVAKK